MLNMNYVNSRLTGFDCFPRDFDDSDESIPDNGADLAEYEPESYVDSWETSDDVRNEDENDEQA